MDEKYYSCEFSVILLDGIYRLDYQVNREDGSFGGAGNYRLAGSDQAELVSSEIIKKAGRVLERLPVGTKISFRNGLILTSISDSVYCLPEEDYERIISEVREKLPDFSYKI